jgi:hypothetical protein
LALILDTFVTLKKLSSCNPLECLLWVRNRICFLPTDPSCQLVTQSAWKRGFLRLPWLATLLCLFFPFLVWTPLVKFQVYLLHKNTKLIYEYLCLRGKYRYIKNCNTVILIKVLFFINFWAFIKIIQNLFRSLHQKSLQAITLFWVMSNWLTE